MLKFAKIYLMLLADGMILIGLAMMIEPDSVLFAPIVEPTLAALAGAEAASEAVRALFFFAFGLAGAATVGWGVLSFYVAWKPFGRGEPWAWQALAGAVLVWFVVDSAFCWIVGAPAFIAFNLAMLVLAAIPLIATRGLFMGGAATPAHAA